jgi:hypothetical protein
VAKVAREQSQVRAWPLLCATAALEAMALAGIIPVHADITHAVALPPLDLTYDLGLLLAHANTPIWFSVGLVLSLAGRATLLSLMLGSLRRFWFALRFELVCLVPSFVAAQLMYSGQTVLYAYVFWAGLVVAVAFTLLLAHVPWRQCQSVGRAFIHGLIHGIRLPTVSFYLLGLAVVGVLVRNGGQAADLVGLLASSALTFVTARKLRSQPSARVATSLGAAVVSLVVLAAIVIPKAGSTHAETAARAAPRQGELVMVPGIDTSSGHGTLFLVKPQTLGFPCARTFYYSYAGPGPGAPRGQSACPITSGAAYTRADTERPLGDLVSSFRAQVDSLKPPVTVVAHSSGSWIAWAALSSDRTSPVRHLVMFAPLTGALGYPPPGPHGEGFVGAAGMRLVVQAGRSLGITRFDPDSPLAMELLAPAGRLANLFDQPLPHSVESLDVVSVFDASIFADSTTDPFPRSASACLLFETHSGLPTSSEAANYTTRFLEGKPTSEMSAGCSPFTGWVADAGAAFGVP